MNEETDLSAGEQFDPQAEEVNTITSIANNDKSSFHNPCSKPYI